MFHGKLRNHERPIGLDVRDQEIRLLQLTARGDRLNVTAAACVELPADIKPGSPQYAPALQTAIQDGLKRGPFVGKSVISSLPHSTVYCKNLRLPPMPGDELRAAVQWEAEERFRLGNGQTSVQYLYAGEVSQGAEQRLELIVMAARLSEVEAHVAALVDAGLRPAAIDAAPTALAYLTRRLPQPLQADTSRVLIEIDQDVSRVLIMRDQQILFYKPIDIAGRQFDTILSGQLKLPLAQATARRRELDHVSHSDDAAVIKMLEPALNDLGREIGLCLRYFGVTFRGSRPEEAQLLGQAASPWLAQLLGTAAGIDLQIHDPLRTLELHAVRDIIEPGREPGWAVAAGLSLRDVSGISARRAA